MPGRKHRGAQSRDTRRKRHDALADIIGCLSLLPSITAASFRTVVLLAMRTRMSGSHVIWTVAALIFLLIAGFGLWMINLPAASSVAKGPPVSSDETNAMLAALKPKRERPLIAIVGINDATETT